MKQDDMTGHFVGILLVLAMLSCAAALETPTASEPDTFAFEENAAAGPSSASDAEPLPFSPYVAYSP